MDERALGEALGFLFTALFSDAVFVNIAVFIVLIDSDDGSGGDTGIDVRGSIQRIENRNILLGFGKDGVLVGVDKVDLFCQNQSIKSKSKSRLENRNMLGAFPGK